jgi:hypothetical protein
MTGIKIIQLIKTRTLPITMIFIITMMRIIIMIIPITGVMEDFGDIGVIPFTDQGTTGTEEQVTDMEEQVTGMEEQVTGMEERVMGMGDLDMDQEDQGMVPGGVAYPLEVTWPGITEQEQLILQATPALPAQGADSECREPVLRGLKNA